MRASSDVYLFADFRFDRASGGLFRRDDNGAFASVTIGSRALDLLTVLIQRRGDVVSKEQIAAAVWPNMAVEKGNLFVQISALRAILDNEQSGQSCIQTVAGRGYRFITPVTRCAASRSTPAEIVEPTRADSASSSEGAGPFRLSIVVLPFANLGGDPEQEYFADGVTDSLTTDLSRIRGAFVIGRSTAFIYKDKAADVRQIGRELNVRYVVEGSVQRGEKCLRVNVQLLDADTACHIWAERFDKPVTDFFDMQDEIVSRLANALGEVLMRAEAQRTERAAIPESMDHYDLIDGKLALGSRNLEPQKQKNITPVEAFAIDQSSKTDEAVEPERTGEAQTIRYCRAPDGVRLAYAISGSGPVLVKSGNWMNHLEYDWESPIWGHVFRGLSREHTLIRYDARGNGMSDWDVDRLSLDAWVTDLETVVDAVGIERFPVLGISQGGPVAVAYSVRHPERVSHIILYGTFALGGKKRAPAEKEMRDAMTTLMRIGWGADNPSFRQMFTARFIPGATQEQGDYFNELQLKTTSPENAARYFDVVGDFDVTGLLPKVKAPALVMHVRGDAMCPFEAGRQLAAGIPSAHFVALPGRNHLFLEHEPASDRFFEEINLFLRG